MLEDSKSKQREVMIEWFRERRICIVSGLEDRKLILAETSGEDFRARALERMGTLEPLSISQAKARAEIASSTPLWNLKDENDFAHGKSLLQSLQFDALSYSAETLIEICVEIFVELELDSRLGISTAMIRSFISSVRNRMLENPFHNWFHVVDVLQTTYCLGLQSGLIITMTDKERFALLIAAICHDLEHVGVNNMFLVKSGSRLAELYSMDAGCLEKHHSYRAFELLSCDEHALLDPFSPAERKEIVMLVEDLILATDMGRHGEFMAALSKGLQQGHSSEGSLDETPVTDGTLDDDRPQRKFMAELLIKCADTSNVFKPFAVARRWAVRITDEFFLQGELERMAGMDVTPMCDGRTQSRVAIQKGFIDFVVGPFCRAMAQRIPGLAPIVEQLDRNRAAWERYVSDDALLREAGDDIDGGNGE